MERPLQKGPWGPKSTNGPGPSLRNASQRTEGATGCWAHSAASAAGTQEGPKGSPTQGPSPSATTRSLGHAQTPGAGPSGR